MLDPVLHYHLQEQAPLILSKTLLDFVHPDEQASARNDLKGALKDEALHGSVTRRVNPAPHHHPPFNSNLLGSLQPPTVYVIHASPVSVDY